MDIKISGNGILGEINAIPSKSDVHRALICAALGNMPSRVNFDKLSEDITATISCLKSLGARILIDENGAFVEPIGEKVNIGATLDCGESGSTIRFLLPVAAALGAEATFTGKGRLGQRPLEPLSTIMSSNGCTFSNNSGLPFKVNGKLQGNEFSIQGNVSSQFVTGLLLALPLIGGGAVKVLPPVESKKYIDMTVNTMKKFGITVTEKDNNYSVTGTYKIENSVYDSDGDWSNAAFFLAAGAINGSATVRGVCKNSLQADSKIAEILTRFGAEVNQADTFVTVKSRRLKGIEIDASQIPDLVPVLSVVAAFAQGKTKIYNAGRLRIKESDRLSAVAKMLGDFGVNITEYSDYIVINGNSDLKCVALTDSFNDHRMVMSAAVFAISSGSQITVKNAHAVNKSYPSFFKDFALLGGKYNVL